MDNFIKSYKKTKNSRWKDKGDVIKSLLENSKINDTIKRRNLKMNKARSMPKLNLKKMERGSVPRSTGFNFWMKKSLIEKEIRNLEINFKSKLTGIEEEIFPKIKLPTERRKTNLSIPLILPKKFDTLNCKIWPVLKIQVEIFELYSVKSIWIADFLSSCCK